MTVWVFFLFVYSQCVQTPLDSLDPDKSFDIWEIALYGMAASFFVEGEMGCFVPLFVQIYH